MKTDLEKFIDLYKGFGLELIATEYYNKGEDKNFIGVILADYDHGFSIACSESDKFVGYSGFYSIVTFTLDGEFVEQGLYE